MFAVVITFTIRPESIADFMPLMHANADTSRQEEPGCHRFDVATDPARPGEVFLYELYTDADAFAAHLGSDHFKTFAAQTDDMIATKTVTTYESVRQ